MADEEQSPDRLLVRMEGDAACVRVEGRGSFRISPALKDFGIAALEQGARRLVFDFQACVGMDSTFMGVIAGLCFRYRKAGKGSVVALNLSSRTRHLLGTLGLDRLLEIREAPAPAAAPPAVETVLAAPPAAAQDRWRLAADMVEAHEDLVRVSDANAAKFKDVLAFLREDLRRSAGEESP